MDTSHFILFNRCPKLYWLVNENQEHFTQKQLFEKRAFDHRPFTHKLFPGTLDLSTNKDRLSSTLNAIQEGVSTYGGALAYQGHKANAHFLLHRQERWHYIEVLPTLKFKHQARQALAWKIYLLTLLEIPIQSIRILLLRKHKVKENDPHLYRRIFKLRKIKLNHLLPFFPNKDFQKSIPTKRPTTEIGRQCLGPFPCIYHATCWEQTPKQHLLTLSKGGLYTRALWQRGVRSITSAEIDQNKLTKEQRIQVMSIKNQMPHMQKPPVLDFLQQLKYPLYFLDFELYQPTIPQYSGIYPFQMLPFLYSLHSIETEASEIKHIHYFIDQKKDQRKALALHLKEHLQSSGSIFVYNISQEGKQVQRLADLIDDAQWGDQTVSRMLDLWTIFKSFHYYHPLQYGKTSLKAVYSAITQQQSPYTQVEDGFHANLLYEKYFQKTEARETIKQSLIDYCKQDTMSMITILEHLKKAVVT